MHLNQLHQWYNALAATGRGKRGAIMSEEMLARQARAAFEAVGFDVFPEAGGVDLLAVATAATMIEGINPGDLVGIECKLAPTFALLRQCIGAAGVVRAWDHPEVYASPAKGTHYRVAVVSQMGQASRGVFEHFGIEWFTPVMLQLHTIRRKLATAFRFQPRELVAVPSIKIEVAAGVPAPRKHSERKVMMVRLARRARRNDGRVTAKDIREEGLNPAFVAHPEIGFLEHEHRGVYKLLDFRGDKPVAPDLKHPEIVRALEACA